VIPGAAIRNSPKTTLVAAAREAGRPLAVPLSVIVALAAYQIVRAARDRRDRRLVAVLGEHRWVGFR
jgi:hypothetical protein